MSSHEQRKASALGHLALSESGFLFDPTTGNTYTLNATGQALLRSLIQGTPPGQLGAGLATDFEVEEQDAARDAAEFLLQLGELGLVPEELRHG